MRWEQIKSAEQATAGVRPGLLAGVPKALPALLRAYEIGTRAAAVGFDWSRTLDVLDTIDEEVRELRAAVVESPARAADELGDVLFSVANLARRLGVEPESALRQANDKFTRRFAALELDFAEHGRAIHGATADEFDAAWRQAKIADGSEK